MPVGVSPQRFVIDATIGLRHDSITGVSLAPSTNNVAPSRTYEIKTFRPAGWPTGIFEDDLVGLNVSEPLPQLAYYPQPMENLNGTYPLDDAYVDYTNLGATSARDQPVDIFIGNSPIALLTQERIGLTSPEPFLGTEEQYCSAFLQRLADPTLPYDPDTNPYRSVDWMTIDLTVFTGEDSGPALRSMITYAEQTRERNGNDAAGNPSQALFSYETRATNESDSIRTVPALPAPRPIAYFEYDPAVTASGSPNFTETLGYLNLGFGPTLGSTVAMTTPMTTNDRGQPLAPFAMHPWLNRPFSTHLELMIVPACSQGRLFEEFTTVLTGTNPAIYPDSSSADDPLVFYGPFRHLMNFFHSGFDSADARS